LTATANNLLGTIDTDTGNIQTNTAGLSNAIITLGSGWTSSYGQVRSAYLMGVLRSDTLVNAGSGIQNDDMTLLQVNALGALYTTGGEVEDEAVQSEPLLIGGRYDSSARDLDPGDAGAIALNASGHVLTAIPDGGGQGVKVTTGAGDHIVLGGDVTCQKIDIQAQTDNTGLIAVGFNNVDVTEASGDGIILYAGDTYSLEVNNLNLIYIDSTVTGDGVRYTYFT